MGTKNRDYQEWRISPTNNSSSSVMHMWVCIFLSCVIFTKSNFASGLSDNQKFYLAVLVRLEEARLCDTTGFWCDSTISNIISNATPFILKIKLMRHPLIKLLQIVSDEHAPEQFRVIGVLSNLNEFAAAFQCKQGTRMNPLPSNSTKCNVW